MKNKNIINKNSPIKFIANWILFFIITAGVLHIISIVFATLLSDNLKFTELSNEFRKISISIIYFLKPFITLTLILFVVEWILEKLGIDLTERIIVLIKNCNTKKM